MSEFWNVIHCSFGTLLIFFAFTTCQSIIAEAAVQNGYGSQGFYTLSAMYLTFGISSLVTVGFITRIGSKMAMVISSFCYLQWVLCGLIQVWYPPNFITITLLIISAIICGFGSALFWVGQGKDCSNDKNKGFHFGVGFSFFSFSTIIGHLSGALLIKFFSYTIFLIVMSLFSLMSVICLYTLKDVRSKEHE